MSVKNTIVTALLFITIPLFSQQNSESKGIFIKEKSQSYLDSIKKSFVKDAMASCVDSLWMKELTDLDLYNDITNDITNINTDVKVDYELSTDLLKARLEAMNAKSPFRIEYNQSLENVIKSFLKNRKKAFGRLMAISEYYFPLFEEEFAKQNVPLEIKYLAVVESALNPKAVSRMGATGLWQFMYQTGKQYNLKIDSYIDERSDPLKATAAAAKYMSNMYGIFGDWELVLASYNSGPGNVSKAIRRSGGKQDYWSIRNNLPKETQGYVPAFLATMYLYEYRKEHGIIPDRAVVQHFATDTVMIKKEMSFKQISDLLDVPVAQLQLLNPSYKLNIVPAYSDEKHFLRLPNDKIALFTSNEDKLYAYVQYQLDEKEAPFRNNTAIATTTNSNTIERESRVKTKYYKVKKGDNLGSIATENEVSVADLKKWNGLRSNTIAYGQNLKIVNTETVVQKTSAQTATAVAANNRAPKEEKNKKENLKDSLVGNQAGVYVVQNGDTFNTIAEKYQVTVAQIKEWNNLTDSNLRQGLALQITNGGKEAIKMEVAQSPELKEIFYTVQKGDNLSNIAKKFGASVESLKEWNDLPTAAINLGSQLIVAKDEIAITTNAVAVSAFKVKNTSKTTVKEAADYYVKKGDSLFSIAKKYPGITVSDIKKWNDIKGESIKPGMKLKING
ncbi:LysM peptidoglycan-binding domain-containing protein [Flavobacterium sp.]|uniref:LysM peptidoglycan-binding domain-containing protein n=1 Tax=Flavobacterium sp. TaxID=239 RepID=UPI002620AF4A|nr:LysM peptidoglycan-binding domain-containing protein [Flavobacterium sp.]MDG2431864.1 LysM peptidoglycan-binding domain-containing protein [Flavobacterium sp.]